MRPATRRQKTVPKIQQGLVKGRGARGRVDGRIGGLRGRGAGEVLLEDGTGRGGGKEWARLSWGCG